MKAFIFLALLFSFLFSFFAVQAIEADLISSGDDIEEAKSQCALRISFGSYSSGIPRDIAEKIEKLLETEKEAIIEIKRWNWGLEGEYDLCPVFKNEPVTNKMHERLKNLIPETSKKGYTILFLNGVETKKTVWPKN